MNAKHASTCRSIFRRSAGIRHAKLIALGAAFALFNTMGGSCTNNSVPGGGVTILGPTGGGGGGGGGGTGGGGALAVESIDHVLGAASAPVTVIEYSDYQCPFCGRFDRQEFSTIKTNYIDNGRVRWVYRHFPLTTIHPRAMPAAEAAECASDQLDFFAYSNLVFGTVDGSGNAILTDQQLQAHITTLGGNLTMYNTCVGGDSKNARIQRDINSGLTLGVTGTPTFFVDSEKVVGFKTAAELGAIIDQHLAN